LSSEKVIEDLRSQEQGWYQKLLIQAFPNHFILPAQRLVVQIQQKTAPGKSQVRYSWRRRKYKLFHAAPKIPQLFRHFL